MLQLFTQAAFLLVVTLDVTLNAIPDVIPDATVAAALLA